MIVIGGLPIIVIARVMLFILAVREVNITVVVQTCTRIGPLLSTLAARVIATSIVTQTSTGDGPLHLLEHGHAGFSLAHDIRVPQI